MSTPETTPEMAHVIELHRHYCALRDAGWREMVYAPKDRPIQVITAGSTGLFTAHYMPGARCWFVEDAHDLWPAEAILWRESPASAKEGWTR